MTSIDQLKLSELTNIHLEEIKAWRVLEDTIEEEDVTLSPAYFTKEGLISKRNGMVWCLCKSIFANGEEFKGVSMCRGDSDEGPLLLSVWNGHDYIRIIMPPAPLFVLNEEGPEMFSTKFDRKLSDIFPMKFEVVLNFEIEPYKRRLVLNI